MEKQRLILYQFSFRSHQYEFRILDVKLSLEILFRALLHVTFPF
jgi:hypothetical protein